MATQFLLFLSILETLCYAQSSFSPARPPAIPLAVKSPYLSTWQRAGSDGGNGGYLAGQWPTFWMGQVTGWTGIIRVDGESYTWLGAPAENISTVTQTAFDYTSTRSIFTQNVNNAVGLTVTFLSGLTPNDFMRASLPFSYMEVEVTSLDGADHDVQLYTDISAEWISGDRSAIAEWNYGIITSGNSSGPIATSATSTMGPSPTSAPPGQTFERFGTKISYSGWTSAVTHSGHPFINAGRAASPTTSPSLSPTSTYANTSSSTSSSVLPGPTETDGIAYHQIYRQTQLAFSEVDQQTEYGNWYYLTANTNALSHQSGADVDVRGQFVSNGTLANTADTDYRAIDDDYPVFGFAIELGSVGSQSVSSLFGISLAQENAIQFEGSNGNETVPSLWTSYFANDLDAISFFYNDYSTESSMATDFDNMVSTDSAAAGGDNYTTITSLAARQAFGAVQLCGTVNTTYLFLKEISSDGNIQTVDVIFPFHPILIYTNPTLVKLVLEPLFIQQEAGYWPFAFAIHDLGASYPNATGHNDGNAEQQPLEECGNMIIMALAYAQRANDDAWLETHYAILRQWNEYLVEEALIPMNQISTDDFAGSLANQTNLALKGIIGIEAMAQIANRTGHAADGANYTDIAHSYITQWQTLGVAANATPPHTTLNYGNTSSHGLLYNLYADALLGLSLVPQTIYDMQSTFYPTVADEYGVPLDTRHTWTKSDWQIFCAAIAEDATKFLFIDLIANWINVTPSNGPFTDLYDAVTGDFASGSMFEARPVVGGEFALLALNGAPTSGYVTPAAL